MPVLQPYINAVSSLGRPPKRHIELPLQEIRVWSDHSFKFGAISIVKVPHNSYLRFLEVRVKESHTWIGVHFGDFIDAVPCPLCSGLGVKLGYAL